jgi:hypothetical protein
MFVRTSNSLIGYSANNIQPVSFNNNNSLKRWKVVSNYQDKEKVDRFEKSASSWERVTKSGQDPTLQLIDKHISIAGEILERMKKFIDASRDESLSDEDRIELQIAIGKLQHDFDTETEEFRRKFLELMGVGKGEPVTDKFEGSEPYKMLQRARERILNGEEWDVAEECIAVLKSDGSGEIDRYEWEITDDPDKITVGNILKESGRGVMDPKSAAMSSDKISNELEGLMRQRQKLVTFINKNGADSQEENSSRLNAFGENIKVFLSSLSMKGFMSLSLSKNMGGLFPYDRIKDDQGNFLCGAPGDVLMTRFITESSGNSYEWEITDDPDNMTVGNPLRESGKNVLDSESAEVSSAKINRVYYSAFQMTL